MNCERWTPVLHDYLEGLLKPEQEECVRAHLQACADCRRLLQEWRQIGSLLRALPEMPARAQAIVVQRAANPLFQPSQVAALWAGLALPGAWILQRLAALINWQSLIPVGGVPSLFVVLQWLEHAFQWMRGLVG